MGPEGLIRVHEEQGAGSVGELDKGLEILLEAGLVIAMARRYESDISLEGLRVPIQRDLTALHRHPAKLGSETLVSLPDVTHGGELGLGHHDRVTGSVVREGSGHGRCGLGHRCADRDIPRIGVDQSSELGPRLLHFLDPGVPVHPVVPPGVQVALGRFPHRGHLRPL